MKNVFFKIGSFADIVSTIVYYATNTLFDLLVEKNSSFDSKNLVLFNTFLHVVEFHTA